MAQKILIIGAGGLGTPAAWAIASSPALVPDRPLTISIIDPESVELSNLNRQVLFTMADLGKPKAELLAATLASLYPCAPIKYESICDSLNRTNIFHHLAGVDLVLECSDSTEVKFLVNDHCVTNGIPFIYAGVVGTAGQLLAYNSLEPRGGCLRCMFGDFTQHDLDQQTASCRQAGIVGPIAGQVGLAQGALAAAALSGASLPAPSLFWRFTEFGGKVTASGIVPDPDCALGCGLQHVTLLDMRKRTCPSTFVFTKLALEQMAEETVVDARYSSAESAANVSRSLREEGHRIIGTHRVDSETWRVLIQKRTIRLEELV